MLEQKTNAIDVEKIRSDFPILAQHVRKDTPLIYLDNAASTQRPSQVIDAMNACYNEYYSNVHRGSHTLSMKASDAYESARLSIQRFIGAEHSSEVIFTSGTTMAINIVAYSWGNQHVGKGDEIILTLMEHHSNIVPWQQLAQRTGATIRFIGLDDQQKLNFDELVETLSEKTKLVCVCGISNVLGVRNDIASITKKAHAVGAKVVVDAAQSAPHELLKVSAWNADFIAFGAHKMLGPSGIGILYGKRDLLESMPPFIGGGSMISSVTVDGFKPGDLPARFEAGTPAIAESVGFEAAIEYLEEIGLENIEAHEQRLVTRAMHGLQQIDGIKILGPQYNENDSNEKGTCERAGIISFAVDGCNTHDISTLIDRYGVAIRDGHHCAMPLHHYFELAATCRCSFYLYNTDAEVDCFLEALHKVINKLR